MLTWPSVNIPISKEFPQREYPVSGDNGTVRAEAFTPSVGDVWHAPGVFNVINRHVYRRTASQVRGGNLDLAASIIRSGIIL